MLYLSKKKSAIWSFFSSVQLAIVLIALVAFFALVGTLVPQREAAAQLAEKISPALFSFCITPCGFSFCRGCWPSTW